MSVTDAPSGILTFLIADMRGWTTFTQTRGDEAAARLADKFADIAREGVEAHGGEVTELRGDEALAVFSSPRAALRAAVSLQAVFADESAIDPDLPLNVGMGIDAGEAVPVQGGYRGGALNLAARLCSRAAAGEVLVSQGIAHLARTVEGIALEEYGEAEVKGLAEPVRVFRASTDGPVAPSPRPTAEPAGGELPAALDIVTPIVGRGPELRRLRWSWRQARRDGRSVVVVQGASGIGKTRLVAELAATAASGGGHCRYASLVDPRVDLGAVLDDLAPPGLVVIDDLDAATPEQARLLADTIARHPDGAALVVVVVDDDNATDEVLSTARRLAGSEERIVRLRPLLLEEMLQVAALYVGAAVDAVPRELFTASGGVPRQLHEQIGEWAHAQAAQRLGVLAMQAASGRSDLRSVESDLAGTVIDLQQVREQTRLFGLRPGRHAPEPEEPPYRGLASFDVGDAEFFFGRERLVAELISRLAGAPLLGVVGASGSGKSSAVRAGLVPALTSGVLPGSDGWTVAMMRPGEHPVRALDRALWTSLPRDVVDRVGSEGGLDAVRDVLGADERVVVVIDQFEEVFTLCTDEAEQAAFLASLSAAATDPRSRVVVVAAIRADYYGRCAADPRLAELLAANHVLVGPMNAEEYRRAIVQPALRVGVAIDPALVDELVTQVLGEPGALPLLSTALLELWDHREGRTIQQSAFLSTGGVQGAVARLADEVYDGLDEHQQAVARGILLRLAGPGEGDAVVRRRVPLAEFDAERDPVVGAVLDVLAARRLVTVSDGSVEVAHEALLREWPRLQEWLEEDREGRRLRAHLTASAQEWVGRDRDSSELYRGARLSAALDWTTQHTSELNELERDFVTASRTASQYELDRQRRQNRRLRGLLVGVVGVLVLALVAGGLALVQRAHARTAAREALARELGAEAVSAPRLDQAMLLARQAVVVDNSPQTQGTLLATLLRSPALLGTFTLPIQFRPQNLALSPDGRTLEEFDNGGHIRFFDTATHRQRGPVLNDYGFVPPFYAGSHLIAVKRSPNSPFPAPQVLDASTLRVQQTLQFGHLWKTVPTGQNQPTFASADGSVVYDAWAVVDPNTQADRAAYVDRWNAATGARRTVRLPGVGVITAARLPDGNVRVVTDNAVVTVDGRTLRVIRRTPLSFGPGLGTMAPDGRTMTFVAGAPGALPALTFTLVDLVTGRRTPAGGSHTAAIQDMAFTPDGRTVVSTGDDGKVDVWDAHTGALEQTLLGHTGRVLGLAISADSQTAYTCGLDGAIFAWDLGNARRFGRTVRVAPQGTPSPVQVPALAVSPDGSLFAARTGPGQVGLFSLRTLARTGTVNLAHGLDVTSLAWSRRGVLAVGLASNGVQLWSSTGSPHLLRGLTGISGTTQAVGFSPDGRRVAAVTAVFPPPGSPKPTDGWVGVWDVDTGKLLGKHELKHNAGPVAFSPDGTRVVAGTGDGRIVVITPAGRPVRTIGDANLSNGGIVSTAFAADGTLITGSWSGLVQHWDITTGKQVGRAVLTEPSPTAAVAVDPRGSRFVTTGGSGGGLKIWVDATQQQFGSTFPGGDGVWQNAAYTPDGSTIVVVSDQGVASVWPASLSAWMQHACTVAGRNFTQEEWHRFVTGRGYAKTCPSFRAGP